MPEDDKDNSILETLKALSVDEAASENERELALKAISMMSAKKAGVRGGLQPVDRELDIISSSEDDLEDRLSILTRFFTGSNIIFYIQDGMAHVYGQEDHVRSACALVAYAEGLIQERDARGSKQRNALYAKITGSTGIADIVPMERQSDVQYRLMKRLEREKGIDVVPEYSHRVKIDRRSARPFRDL